MITPLGTDSAALSAQKVTDLGFCALSAHDLVRKPVPTFRDHALALPPDESRADHVIPHCAHQRAAEPGDPPLRVVAVDHRGDADVRDGADRADHLEPDQPGDELPAGEPLVAVGEHVVENEIPGNRYERRDRLRPRKTKSEESN